MCVALWPLAGAAGSLDDPSVWTDHLTGDLLPFWEAARADPDVAAGRFPGRLCNDGALPVAGTSCPGVSAAAASAPQHFLVGQSRQIFSYGVAFHMTGDAAWLDLARAGLDWQIGTLHDAGTGLYHEVYDRTSGTVVSLPEDRNAVKQAYGLLGPTFYYHLTGDTEVYAHIREVSGAIRDGFRDDATGGYAATIGGAGPDPGITAQLDQLNAYQVLLATAAPEADRAAVIADALQTARYLRTAFHDPVTGLMKTRSTDPGGAAAANYGLTVKAYWFIDQIGRIAGDEDLSAFAQDEARALLGLAFQDGPGGWATGQDASGVQDGTANWWSHAELDQFGAMLAMADPALRADVERALDYWLARFVDPAGGIHPNVSLTDGSAGAGRKHWEWKAGFHSYEHALVAMLAAAGIGDTDATLHFARDPADVPLPYGFEADALSVDLLGLDSGGRPISAVTLGNVRLAAPAAPPLAAVPAPPAGLLLAGALLLSLRLGRPPRTAARAAGARRPVQSTLI